MAQSILKSIMGRLLGVNVTNDLVYRGTKIYFGDDDTGLAEGVVDLSTISTAVQALALLPASATLMRLRDRIARADVSNSATAQALIAPTAYANSTAYVQGTAITANSNVYICITSGTSSGTGTGPSTTGNAPITDGTAAFYYWSASFSSSAAAPTMTANQTKYASGNTWTTSAFTGSTPSTQIADTKNFLITGANFTDVNNSGLNPQLNGSSVPTSTTMSVSFYTDATSIQITPAGNAALGKVYLAIYINGVPLTVGYAQPIAAGSGSTNIQLVFPNPGTNLIRVECINGTGFLYVTTIGKLSKVWRSSVPDSVRVAFVGTSYLSGSTWHPVSHNLGIGEQAANLLGVTDSFVSNVGAGAGYINAGSYGNYLSNIAYVTAYNPEVVVITGGGINDSSGSPSQATEQAAVLAYLKAMRVALPNAVIVVVGSESGANGPSTIIFTMEAAVAAAVASFNDPYTFYVTQSGVSAEQAWISGTGNSVSTNGMGNSDLYISTDNVHPVQAGVNYLAAREANAVRAAANALGALTP